MFSLFKRFFCPAPTCGHCLARRALIDSVASYRDANALAAAENDALRAELAELRGQLRTLRDAGRIVLGCILPAQAERMYMDGKSVVRDDAGRQGASA